MSFKPQRKSDDFLVRENKVFTALTKDKLIDWDKHGFFQQDDGKFVETDDVLSALNGLRKNIVDQINNSANCKRCDIHQYEFCLDMMDYWFPILELQSAVNSRDESKTSAVNTFAPDDVTERVDSREQQSKQSFDAPRNDNVSLETGTSRSQPSGKADATMRLVRKCGSLGNDGLADAGELKTEKIKFPNLIGTPKHATPNTFTMQQYTLCREKGCTIGIPDSTKSSDYCWRHRKGQQKRTK